jgi:site-specific DNA-methyltransferase (adenine-specific)
MMVFVILTRNSHNTSFTLKPLLSIMSHKSQASNLISEKAENQAVMQVVQNLKGRKARVRQIEGFLNRFHCSDNVTLMNQMPAESVSCIVTSPPYNLRNSTGNGMKNGNGGKWSNAALMKGYENYDDNMPHELYVKWQRDCLTAMMRVLKNDGVIFYNHKWRVQDGLLQDRSDIVTGFPVRQIIIWKRSGGINFNAGYFLPTYEVIYMICKPDFKLSKKINALGDVWEITQEMKGNTHPAPFPMEIAERCVKASPSGIILDPFMGSGTTALAATKLKRDWIGIELSAEYCNLSRTRLQNFRKANGSKTTTKRNKSVQRN